MSSRTNFIKGWTVVCFALMLTVITVSASAQTTTVKVVDAADQPVKDLYVTLSVNAPSTATPAFTDDSGELIFLNATPTDVTGVKLEFKFGAGAGDVILFSDSGGIPNATYATTATLGDTPSYTDFGSLTMDAVLWIKLDGYIQRGFVVDHAGAGAPGVLVAADAGGDGNTTGELVVTSSPGTTEFSIGEYMLLVSTSWQGNIIAYDVTYNYYAYLFSFSADGNLEVMPNLKGYQNVSGQFVNKSLDSVHFRAGWTMAGVLTEFGGGSGTTAQVLADENGNGSWDSGEAIVTSDGASGGAWSFVLPVNWTGEIIVIAAGYQASATSLNLNGVTYDGAEQDYNVANLSGDVAGINFEAPAGSGSVTVHLVDYAGNALDDFTVKLGGVSAVSTVGTTAVVTVPSTNNVTFESLTILGYDLPRSGYLLDTGAGTGSYTSGTPSGTLDMSTNSHLWIKINGYIGRGTLGGATNIDVVEYDANENINLIRELGGKYVVFFYYWESGVFSIKAEASGRYYTAEPGSMSGDQWSVLTNDINTYTFDMSGSGEGSGSGLNFSSSQTGAITINIVDYDDVTIVNSTAYIYINSSSNVSVSVGGTTITGLDIDSITQIRVYYINGANVLSTNEVSTANNHYNTLGNTTLPTSLAGQTVKMIVNGYILQGRVDDGSNRPLPDTVIRTDIGDTGVWASDGMRYALYLAFGSGANRLYPTKNNATFTATETVQNGNWDDSIGGTNEYGLVIATLTSAHTRDFLGAADNLYGNLTVKLVDWNGDLIDHLYVRLDNIGQSQANAGQDGTGTIDFINISLDVERVTVGFAGTTFTLDTTRGSYSHDSTNGVDGSWSNTIGAVTSGSTLWVKLNGWIAYGAMGSGANSLVVIGGSPDAAWGSEDNNHYAVLIPWNTTTDVKIKARYYVNSSTYYFYVLAASAAPANAFTRTNDINTYTFQAASGTKTSQQTGLDFHDTDRTMLYIRLLDIISDSELINNFRVRLANASGSSLRDATEGSTWDADSTVNGVIQCSGVDIDSVAQINLLRVFENDISVVPGGGRSYPEWDLNNDGGTVPSPFGSGAPGLADVVINEQNRHLWIKIDGYIIQGSFSGATPTITAEDGDGNSTITAHINGSDYSIYVPAANQLATNAGGSNTAPITVKAERAGYIITTTGTGVPNRQSGTLTEDGNKWEFGYDQVDGSPYNLDFNIPNISNLTFVVVNSAGAVVSNAQIRLNNNNSLRARDGDDGTTDGITRFTSLNLNSLTSVGVNLKGIDYLTPDEYSIDATATWTTTIPTLEGANPTIYLKLSDSDLLMLRGTVYDKPQADPTKVPMAGVSVAALGSNGSGNYTATTDSNGVYQIDNVPKGWSGTLMASTPGYSFDPLDIPDLQENISNDFYGEILDTGTDFKFFGEDPDAWFGYYASMTCDGLTMVIGTYNGNKAYIFARADVDSPWSFQRRLIPSDTPTGFGRSVAISPDGGVVVVGAPDSDRAYVYSLAAEGIASWGAAAGDSLEESFNFNTGGHSVRAWDDNAGNYTLFFGSPTSNEVYVYTSNGGTSFSLSATLNGIGPDLGYALDISRDGNVLVVGAPGGNQAHVYVKSFLSPGWDDGINDMLCTLTATGSSALGTSIALNDDGSVVVVGDAGHTANKGAGFVFLAPGNDWTTAGGSVSSSASLIDPDGVSGARLGHSAVISADGDFVIMGAPGENKIVYFGGVWSGTMDPISVQSGEAGTAFGTGLSMNCDGTTVVVGSPEDEGGRGSAEVFSTSTTYYIRGVIVDGSGTGPIQGVTLTAVTTGGNPPDEPAVTTGADGSYEIIVYRGWSGSITPVLSGYSFDPTGRTYSNVFRNYCCDNYTANLNELEITGTITDGNGIPLAGVTVNYGDGVSVTTDGNGEYLIPLPYGWSGVVRPYKAGYDFVPETRTYSSITLDQTSQNYTSALIPGYKIIATAGKGGSISPEGTVIAYRGESKSFFIAPSEGFKVSDVLVDGESIGAIRSYSFSNVRADHTIHAMFAGKANGWLTVIIIPAEAVAEGAAWRVKGHDQWLPSGATLELPPGTYEIEFLDLPHWETCCPVTATVYANKTTIVEDVVYHRIGGDARVHYFVADDYVTTEAAGTNLKWMVTGAEEVLLSFFGKVDPIGEAKVNPDRSTTYWLSAIDEARTIPGTVDIEVMQKPVIDWFITNATSDSPRHAGEEVILSWQTHGAESVKLMSVDGEGDMRQVAEAQKSDQHTLKVDATGKYILVAENAAGEVKAELKVHITELPRVVSFTTARENILAGERTKISWEIVGADDVEISSINNNLKSKGRKTVSPLETTTYKLTASNEAGEVTAEVTVNVEDSSCDLAVQVDRLLFDGFEVTQAYAGSEIVAEVSIVNHGTEIAKGFDLVIYQGKTELARKTLKRATPGKIKKVKLPFISVKTGVLNIIAEVDPERKTADHNFTNNSHTVVFTGLKNNLAELLIKDVEIKALSLDDGKAVEIQFVLHNAGNKKAEDFQVDVEVDGKLVFWEAVDVIKADESILYKTSVPVSKKQIIISILADRYNVIGEVNKGNNLWMNKIKYKNLGINW